MEQAEFTREEVRIKLRDKMFDLQKPLQPTKYAGSNALPSGLEGVSDIKGKPKPVCYGQVYNVPAVCVNTSKLIFQVAAVLAGSACNSVDAVYDRGIALDAGLPVTSETGGINADIGGSIVVYDIAYGNGLYVIVGSDGANNARIVTSTDGGTWTARTHNFPAGDYPIYVAFVNGVFLAGGTGGKLSTSTDGETWTARTTGHSNTISSLGYGNGIYLMGASGGTLYSSTDLATWTSRTSGFTVLESVQSIAYGNGIWIIGGGNDSHFLRYSTNGTTGWTDIDSPFNATDTDNVTALTYQRGYFIAASDAGKIATSPDGPNWTQRFTGVENNPNLFFGQKKLVFVGGRWIWASGGGAFHQSYDEGVTWTRTPTGIANSFSSIATNGTDFVAIAQSDVVVTPGAVGTYANATDLEDDSLAPIPGTYKTYAAGGYFRLGSSPAGTVTADLTQGASSSDRTAAQVFKNLLTRAGFSSSDYAAADITALDTQNSSVIGYWTDEETTFADALDEVASSVGAWWGPDKNGIYRIKQFGEIPAGADYSLTANDMIKPLERVQTQDQGKGIPVFASIVRYLKNHTVQTTDLAAGVEDTRKAIVGKEWREASYTDSTVQTRNLLAEQIEEDSLLIDETSATSEATRRQKLRGRKRDRYVLTVPGNSDTERIDLGETVRITHARYGLSGGASFRVISVEPDAKSRSITLGVWGPHAPPNSGGVAIAPTLSGTGTVT